MRPRSAPRVILEIPFEGSPVVRRVAETEADNLRLTRWLETHPSYVALIQEALALQAEARARESGS